MRIQDILRTIQHNFNIALILVAILGVLLVIGYFIIYKKFLKGNKSLNKRKVFICFSFIGYIIMVIGVTFLNRGVGLQDNLNLHFLSTYREAWNSFNPTNWRFIILNILMLVPFGVLLPLLNIRFSKFSWMVLASFLMTLIIETFQLITGYGIFDLNDIFNNVVGAIIGYGIVMTIITAMESRKNKFRQSVVYLTPLILVIAIYIAIVGVYNSKEFGNLPIAYNYKFNMKNIDLRLNTKIHNNAKEVSLNDNRYSIDKVPIYKSKVYDKSYGKKFFKNFLKHKDIDEEIDVDPYSDMAIYWFRDKGYNMSFNYNGGSYDYMDFSVFDEGIEKIDTDKKTVLKRLKEYNVSIPKSAVFNKSDDMDEVGVFIWNVENDVDGDYITNGRLSTEYYNDDTIKSIDNNIVKYEKVRDISIKSKEEAYEDFKKGKFRIYTSKDIRKIEIENISLSYMLDTKGFYQPIYNFNTKIDGEDIVISIPAL